MVTNIEPTVELLKACVKACADAHHTEFCDWSDELQLAVKGDGVPVVADMRTICQSFYGNSWPLNVDWGYSNIFMDEVPMQQNLDVESLRFALPEGKLDQILADFNVAVSLTGEETAKRLSEKEDSESSRHKKSQELYEKFCESGKDTQNMGIKH